MPPGTADLLAPVVASLRSAHSGRLRGPGVHDPGVEIRVPAKPRTQALAQFGVKALPRPVDAPSPEPLVDGLRRREVPGQ